VLRGRNSDEKMMATKRHAKHKMGTIGYCVIDNVMKCEDEAAMSAQRSKEAIRRDLSDRSLIVN